MGTPRIHGELLKLGFTISEKTVSRYVPTRKPNQCKAQTWLSFLRNHREAIAAMDFFTVSTLKFNILYIFFIIHHKRKNIIHFNISSYPSSQWVIQQLREAFPFDKVPHYVIFDRDKKFSQCVIRVMRSFNIKPMRISYRIHCPL